MVHPAKSFMDPEALARAFSALSIDPPPNNHFEVGSLTCPIGYEIKYPAGETSTYQKFIGSGPYGMCVIFVSKDPHHKLTHELQEASTSVQTKGKLISGEKSRNVVVITYNAHLAPSQNCFFDPFS